MKHQVVIVGAADDAALLAEVDRVVAYLERCPGVALADVALTCAQVRGPASLAIVADSTATLRTRLVSARSRIADGHERIKDKSGTYYFRRRLADRAGKVAFLYTGAFGYYSGMLRELALVDAECRGAFDELEEAMSAEGAFAPSNFVFPPAAHYQRDADVFSAGAYAQALVATHAASAALSRVLAKAGVRADGVVGFAGGDLAAAVRAGTFGWPDRPTRIRVIRDIYRIVYKAVDHAGLPEVQMVSLVLRHEHEADELLAVMSPEKVSLVVDLSPRQKVLAVAPDAADTVLAAFARAGVRALRLGPGRPFNTPACKSLVPAVRKFADAWMRHDPEIAAYSCATAAPVPAKLRKQREDVAVRWACPVRFADTVRRMYDDGYRVFVEVGPKGHLAAAVEDTLKETERLVVPLDAPHRGGILQVQHALAQLAAVGVPVDLAATLAAQGAKPLDFDALLPPEVRRETEMRLYRAFPRMTLLMPEPFGAATPAYRSAAGGRGEKAAQKNEAEAAQKNVRRGRELEVGGLLPLLAGAEEIVSESGTRRDIRVTLRYREAPFIADFSLGNSQLSYADPNLKGLVPLTMPLAAEVLAEAAAAIVPGMVFVSIDDMFLLRTAAFEKGAMTLRIHAERVAPGATGRIAVHVTLKPDAPEGTYVQTIAAGRFLFAAELPPRAPSQSAALSHPRSVHWSGRDVYPMRLCSGSRLRGVTFVEAWSEGGLEYEVRVPPLAGNFLATRFPVWQVNPLLLETVTSGFALWRSHERFGNAFAFPFRVRRFDLLAPIPPEGARVSCHLRLAGVTAQSHLCDIEVTDGNGTALMRISGWEERVEHVRPEYRALVLQPATTFVSDPVTDEAMGHPGHDAAGAMIAEIPYAMCAHDDEVWLKAFAHLVLGVPERKEFSEKTGDVARRTEWLFGRIAAKEAVRRHLKEAYQARWSDADVTIVTDAQGKPGAIGPWRDYLPAPLDVSISHTKTFVLAAAAENARVGVDVEFEERDLSKEFEDGAFSREEQELAAKTAPTTQTEVRFWCAKEAVSKALGVGLRYSPREMNVVSYDPVTGALSMRLGGEWLTAFKQFAGREIPVSVRGSRGHALAFCFIPLALMAR